MTGWWEPRPKVLTQRVVSTKVLLSWVRVLSMVWSLEIRCQLWDRAVGGRACQVDRGAHKGQQAHVGPTVDAYAQPDGQGAAKTDPMPCG